MAKKKEWDYEIDDPYDAESRGTQKVNTEFYLGRLAYEAAKAGRIKYISPLNYKTAVEQLEIFAIGSDLLDKDYEKAKEKLEKEYQKKIKEYSKKINPNLKKSLLNRKMQQSMTQEEIEFVTKLHRLVMKTISSLFYIKRKTIRI
jgi:hypothetical protein